MISWAVAILILDALLYISIVTGRAVPTSTLFFCIGIALINVIIIIRTIKKIKAGRFEKLNSELRDIKSENKELLGRISNLREQQILDRTDEDLV